MKEKKMIRREIIEISRYDFEGTLGEVIARLDGYKSTFRDCANLSIEVESIGYTLRGESLETDEEFHRRCQREEDAEKRNVEAKIKNEQNEREILKNLIKKYGVPEDK